MLDDLENIDIGDKYGYGGSIARLKSEKELEKIFSAVVSYAKKLTIIDPYFYPDVYRYKRTLEIIAKNFGERRNNKTKGSIIIHCKFQIDNYNPWEKKLDKWRSICRHIRSDYGHALTICAWKEKQGGIKMHERYLVTNQIGLVVGAGLDVNDRSTSEFGLKQYNELNDITSPFDKNNPSFDLAYEITM